MYKNEEESPVTNHTWPLSNKTYQRRCHQLKMSSLLSPVTPKRSCNSHGGGATAKSILFQCLRDSKSDPLPRRSRRFLASSSYESDDGGVLMDGVLVTSATGKRVSDSPCSSSLRRSSTTSRSSSSVIMNQHKNAEFSSPRSESGRNQETTRSQHSSAGKAKMLANSPCTKAETPKAANTSKLQATAEPFILTPRSTQNLAFPLPIQQLPYDHDLHFQWSNQQLASSYGHQYPPQSYVYPRPPPLFLHGYDPYHACYISPRPVVGYDFNQSPSSSQLTRETPVHTPVSSTNRITSHGSRLDLPLSVDRLNTVTKRPVLSSPSNKLETRTHETDLSTTCDELQTTMTQKPDLSSRSDKLETTTVTNKPDSSSSLTDKREKTTVMQEQDWSPSDDGIETLTKAQTDVAKSQGRILPDDVFEHYKYRERLPVFFDKTWFRSQDSDST
ncbi:unnamed protein product [Cochlearia groenlandica]